MAIEYTTTSPPITTSPFHPTLLTSTNISNLQEEYKKSKPYHHAVVSQLFDPEFLRKAREELVEQVSFTEKETDIYRINQTGDLTNLSGLPTSELALLQTVLTLRDSLYSAPFRQFLQSVTGCGPLSGIKTDMSCAEYTTGNYLLNHDDVIGTRRISFILYLVLEEPSWKPEWGGALELYPVLPSDPNNPDRPNVPAAIPTTIIPPAFNQFTFFAVQPGHSFHSVEEVVVESDGKRGGVGSRMSISGWFHRPTETEEGYEKEDENGFGAKSSLQQLYATTLQASTIYETPIALPLPAIPSADEINSLKPYINPAYLSPSTLTHLRDKFISDSHIVLSEFLNKKISTELESLIRSADSSTSSLSNSLKKSPKYSPIPPHNSGLSTPGWEIIGPPHIQRFLSLASTETNTTDRLTILLRELDEVFKSLAFRTLLACLTSLAPLAFKTQVRRFRPGLDYTLARGEPVSKEGDEEIVEGGGARLDVGLSLTPIPKLKRDRSKWEGGEFGGWELWLNGTDEGEDEATYGGNSKKAQAPSQSEETTEDEEEVDEEDEDEEEDEEDDGPLLGLEPSWNRLALVLRDEGVLKFTKYLSGRAPGSRWDIGGEWEVKGVEEDDDEEMEDAQQFRI